MEGTGATGGPNLTGGVPGPGPKPPQGGVLKKVQEALKHLGFGGVASSGIFRVARSSFSASSSTPLGMGASQVSESVDLSQLGDMAVRLSEGGRLTAKRGILEAAHRPRFFADLTQSVWIGSGIIGEQLQNANTHRCVCLWHDVAADCGSGRAEVRSSCLWNRCV